MCDKGVQQGENLSPLLFSIFLNDVEQYIHENHCNGVNIEYEENALIMFLKIAILLYADDTVLIADTHRDMQLLLDSFSEYCNTWKLKINIDKTKSMIWGKCRKKEEIHYQ